MSNAKNSQSVRGWYAVKTAYRTLGRWKAPPGKRALPGRVSEVQERVVLIRARSWGEAADRALAEAQRYASKLQGSKGGPRWGKARAIDACAVYALETEPGGGTVVFSLSDYQKREVPLREILSSKFNGYRIQCTTPLSLLRKL